MNKKKFKLDFIGIGAPKCGTTWIAKCLSEHPQICLSTKKELNYFNKINMGLPNKKNNLFYNDFDWYKTNFLHCHANKKKANFQLTTSMTKKLPV